MDCAGRTCIHPIVIKLCWSWKSKISSSFMVVHESEVPFCFGRIMWVMISSFCSCKGQALIQKNSKNNTINESFFGFIILHFQRQKAPRLHYATTKKCKVVFFWYTQIAVAVRDHFNWVAPK